MPNPYEPPADAPPPPAGAPPPPATPSFGPEFALWGIAIAGLLATQLCGDPTIRDALCLGSAALMGLGVWRMFGMGKEAG